MMNLMVMKMIMIEMMMIDMMQFMNQTINQNIVIIPKMMIVIVFTMVMKMVIIPFRHD